MKKILVGYIINGTHSGIDKYLLNFLEQIYNENIQVDFLTNKIVDTAQERVKKYNSKLIEIPRLIHPIKQYKEIKRICKEGNYDIGYFNISEAYNCIATIAAKKSGVKKVVIHSHLAGTAKQNKVKIWISKVLNSIFKKILYHYGDLFLACSKKAGLWLYPKKIVESDQFHIMYNTVDAEKFKYDEEIRGKIRKENNLEDKVVVGHIGNFIYAKNHKFIINMFSELSKEDNKYHLLLIGTGDLLQEIKDRVKEFKIEDRVTFTGVVNNVNEWMQAMDVFILPSLVEGLPIVGIESQFSGLPAIFSDTISDEVIITEKSKMLPITDIQVWKDKIKELSGNKRGKAELIDRALNYNNEHMKKQFEIIVK